MTKKSVTLGVLYLALCLYASTNLAAESREATAASYVELGDKLARGGNLDLAIGAYGVALQFAPDFAHAYFSRALAYQARGDFSKAVADFTKTIDIVPQCAEAYANRAYVLALSHEVDRAFGDWAVALEINPRLTNAF